MENLLPTAAAFLVYVSPTVVALLWAKLSAVSKVRRSMAGNAKLVFFVISTVFLLNTSVEAICDGSGLKGFGSCGFLPTGIANSVLPITMFSLAALCVWLILSIAVCGWAEFSHAKNR